MTSRDIIIHSAIHECYTQLFELNMCLKLVHIYTTWNSTFLLPRKSKKNGILYCKLVYDESLAENFGNDSCFSYLKITTTQWAHKISHTAIKKATNIAF